MAYAHSIRGTSILHLALAIVALLSLTACWIAKQEVISSGQGEKIPFTDSQSNLQKKGKLYLSPVAYSNDYRFRFEGTDKQDCIVGTFRAVHLQGNIYALQVRCDDHDSEYNVVFYGITANDWWSVEPDPDVDMKARAKRYNVKFEADELSGDPSDIYDFLSGLNDIEFVRQ